MSPRVNGGDLLLFYRVERAPKFQDVVVIDKAVNEDNSANRTEKPAEPGLLRQAGEFITDMGDFLLAALPYLAVLAVPAVIAAVLRRRKKNG